MNEEIENVLKGISHTGYTTELEKAEARILIEKLYEENQQLKKDFKDFKSYIHDSVVIEDVFLTLRIARFSSLENCFVFLYDQAHKNKNKILIEYFNDVMRSIRGFDSENIDNIFKKYPHLDYRYNEWMKNRKEW